MRNVRQMDIFRNEQGPYNVNRKHSNFDKHTSLLRNPYITYLYGLYKYIMYGSEDFITTKHELQSQILDK